MAISNIIGTIGTIMPLRAPSGLSSIAPAGSRENTAPPSTPVLVNLSGLPANTPENVKRLTNRIVQVQERLDYILKVYVIGMNNIAATQMYVALDILETSPLYRHNLKRFVKEAIALHEKYQGKLRRGFQDKESEYFFSDFYTHMEKHFTPLTMKLRATAMNIANALHQQNPVILASMVTAERLLSMADIYYDKAIEKTIEVSGLSLNYHERYDYLSFKRIHQNWLNAVRQLSKIRFEDSIDLVAVCNEIVSFISTNSASNKAAETAATLNRENFPEVYQEIQDAKVQKVAGKLKDKYKVTKLK